MSRRISQNNISDKEKYSQLFKLSEMTFPYMTVIDNLLMQEMKEIGKELEPKD